MLLSTSPFLIPIITWATLLAMFSVITILAILKYKSRQKIHMEEVERMKIAFDNEILRAALETKEQTLTEVSREIHDNIGQILSLVKLNLSRLASQGVEATKLNDTKDLVSTAIKDLRSLSKSLNSEYIERKSLKELIELQALMLKNIGTYKVTCHFNGIEKPLLNGKRIVVFRTIQELINNIIKHAKADKIIIEVSYFDAFLGIHFFDNGQGFDVEKTLKKDGSGLRNIKKRMEMVGGNVSFDSRPDEGTSVEITIPYGKS